MRRDVAHKTSYLLANDDRYQLFVFEDLKTKNMTKRAKPKMDENGKWIRNGAAAKSGLNKSILGSTWGYSEAGGGRCKTCEWKRSPALVVDSGNPRYCTLCLGARDFINCKISALF
jgi:hypothetical protein